MKDNGQKKKKMLLIVLLLSISLGYAILTANLNINGFSIIANSSWDIHFENVNVKSGSVPIGTNDQAATITQNDNTEVTYAIHLSKPGDYYEFTVDAKNDGTIDGMVEVVTSTIKIGNNEPVVINNNNLPSYLKYKASYKDGSPILQNHYLKAGQREPYKVRIEYKEDITDTDLPSTDQSIEFSFKVKYKQADDNAINPPHEVIIYTKNMYDADSEDHNYININEAFPETIIAYDTGLEAQNTWLKNAHELEPFYLKHKVVNGIVKESYVEFIITPEMAAKTSGLTAGTYDLRGYNGSVYQSNRDVLIAAFGSNNCTEGNNRLNCSSGTLSAAAHSNGYVSSGNSKWVCRVYSGGRQASCFKVGQNP